MVSSSVLGVQRSGYWQRLQPIACLFTGLHLQIPHYSQVEGWTRLDNTREINLYRLLSLVIYK